ncbi:MAG: YihA family ribosome biogenesis GTP-binding protein [Burkholderiaceae bacterium]|nr:YihA family ribosome biogenesis GTP-binding protein [Burkholderiaceae bacterium]
MSALFDSAKFKMSVSDLAGLPSDGLPQIAFAGRSNAGKSTTINVLTRQTRLAFSSKTPGRTQLLNFFAISEKLDVGQYQQVAYLVDLPGYGFAKAAPSIRATWENLVGGYVAQSPLLEGIVLVMDARRPFMPADELVLDFIAHRTDLKLLFLLNKADQLKTMERRRVLKLVQDRCQSYEGRATCQLFSGLKREGVDELQQNLASWLGKTL